MQPQIQIRHGIPPALCGAAARLYWRHFAAALQPLPTAPRQGAALVRSAMQPDRAIIALTPQGGLIALAGLRNADGGFLSGSAAGFIATFGPARGRLRHLATGLHRGGTQTGDLILDGVAVRRGWQRRGIARALVLAAEAEARRQGYPALLAEVEAANDAALAAWQRLGFCPIGHQRQGWPWNRPAHVLRRPVPAC